MTDVYRWYLLFGGLALQSRRHGSPAWSAIALLRRDEEVVLLDTGGPQYRTSLITRLSDFGLRPGDVTAVALSHCHWDHMCNLPMFPNATVFVSDVDLAWAATAPRDDPFVPHLHVADLMRNEKVVRIGNAASLSDRLQAVATPGHTPGHTSFLAQTQDGPVLFAGDAVKNEHELRTGVAAMTLDEKASRRSIQRLANISRDTGALLVCGHDGTFTMRDGAGPVREPTEPEVLVAAPRTVQVEDAW